jgi:phosphate transport system substrate-binding protein
MFKKSRIAFLLVAIAMLCVIISACGSTTTTGSSSTPTTAASTLGTPGAYNCETGTITAAGSTALQPLVSAVAKKYQAKCSGSTITVNLGGSGAGLTGAENGSDTIGNSDIFSKTGQEDLVDHQVAVVVFSLIVNAKVTGVTSLTTTQLKGIYAGTITNWSTVGGPNLPIVVVSRPTSSGTRATFQKYVLGTVETVTGPSNLTTDSTGTVVTNVQQTDGAIGYVSFGPAQGSGLTILKIDGVAPSPATVENNTYKFWNIEHMYTKGAATPLAQALIDYMTSPDGKAAAASLKFIAITDVPQAALQTHQIH